MAIMNQKQRLVELQKLVDEAEEEILRAKTSDNRIMKSFSELLEMIQFPQHFKFVVGDIVLVYTPSQFSNQIITGYYLGVVINRYQGIGEPSLILNGPEILILDLLNAKCLSKFDSERTMVLEKTDKTFLLKSGV